VSEQDSHIADIADRVDREYAAPWRPEAGDKLVGLVTELSQREGAYGTYPIVTVRGADGRELAFHAFHQVAQNELARAKPAIGERVAVKYLGMKDGAGGGYHAYRVAVDRVEPALNWDAYADPDDTPPF
jgi:hypothetical protein